MSENDSGRQAHSQKMQKPADQLPELLAVDLRCNFELMMLTYQNEIKAFVWKNFSLAQHYADDIVQEVFVSAFKDLSKKLPDEIRQMLLRPWLYKIAKNESINHCKRYNRFTLTSLDIPETVEALEHLEEGRDESPETEVERRETYQVVRQYIDQLPMPLKIVVYLHYICEFEYKEVAEILNVPFNTVKSNGRRGIIKLGQMMGGEVK